MKIRFRLMIGVFLCAFRIAAQSEAISGATPANARYMPPLQSGDPNANLPWQPVRAGDLISVVVADCPEMSRAFRVADDGSINVPLIQNKLYVSGMKPPEIEQLISDAAKSGHLLVRPSVSVGVIEYRSRPVSVVGAVHHPLVFQAVGDVKLLDAIAKADGLTAEAGPEIILTSPQVGADGARTLLPRRIPVRQLLLGKDSSLNLPLLGGEEIRIPEADKIYVIGNVKMPSAIPVHGDTETTVLKVLAQCQGLTPYATKLAYVYRVKLGTTDREEITVPLSLIVHRKAPDVTLLANDVLFIPDATGKRVTLTTLEKLGEIGGSTVSGMLIWNRF